MNRDVAIADLEHARHRVTQALDRVAFYQGQVAPDPTLDQAQQWLREAGHSIDRAVNELRYG